MEINTKYDLNYLVWFVTGNKVKEVKITCCRVCVDENKDVTILYDINYQQENIPEEKLFKTKEELLKSL